jgi:hypothetical protein
MIEVGYTGSQLTALSFNQSILIVGRSITSTSLEKRKVRHTILRVRVPFYSSEPCNNPNTYL